MIQAEGGQIVEHMVRKDGIPLIGDEYPINVLQSQVRPFVAPCKKSFIDMALLKSCSSPEELHH
jgi:hypothetical protein